MYIILITLSIETFGHYYTMDNFASLSLCRIINPVVVEVLVDVDWQRCNFDVAHCTYFQSNISSVLELGSLFAHKAVCVERLSDASEDTTRVHGGGPLGVTPPHLHVHRTTTQSHKGNNTCHIDSCTYMIARNVICYAFEVTCKVQKRNSYAP